jgi:hypothetical protein
VPNIVCKDVLIEVVFNGRSNREQIAIPDTLQAIWRSALRSPVLSQKSRPGPPRPCEALRQISPRREVCVRRMATVVHYIEESAKAFPRRSRSLTFHIEPARSGCVEI